jgi:hypothetical protein
MNLKDIIKSQYHASLDMTRRAIERCPAEMWDDQARKNRFWHIAYHALFYTHLYLQPSEADFVPWEKSREDYQFMGALPWPPHDEPEIDESYTQEELLEYQALIREGIDATVDSLDLHGPSGFEWLPFSKIELQFYSIRHLMQHTGELCERLGEEAKVEVDWIGSRPA